MGPVGLVARREGGGDRRGVIGLLRPRLGIGAEQLGEPRARLLGPHRLVAGWRTGRRLGPFGEPQPHAKTRRPAWRIRIARGQRGEDRRSPQPAAAVHRLGHRADFGIGLCAELLEQGACRGGERHAGFGRAARQTQPERLGEAARRRHAKPRRADKGEELEQVECRERRHVEPPRGGPRVAQHRRFALDPAARLGRCQRFDLAVRAEPQHLTETGDEDRGLRHQDPRGRKFAIASGHERHDLSYLRREIASLRSQ